jgi:hypothetical protein
MIARVDSASRESAVRLYRRASYLAAGALALSAAIAWLLAPGPEDFTSLTRFLFLHQDLGFVAGFVALFLIQGRWTPSGSPGSLPELRRSRMFLLALGLLLLCWAGHRIVLLGYDMSRDEQLANFDAAIYAQGVPFAHFPDAWRAWAGALNQTFLLPIGDHEGWVSAYLPVNAMARALVGMVADPALTSPLFVAIGAIALWRIAARLWPSSPGSQLAALLFYAGSSQLLVAGMTAYAMSGHVALDLAWLALFLRGGRIGHGGAILVGLLATGLHQPLFHPLFVLPFLDLLLRRRQWRLLALYVAAYGAIGLFWLGWPLWVASQATTVMPAHLDVEGVSYLDRLRHAVPNHSPGDIGLMAANLVRFMTWQHLLAVPLAILAVAALWKRDPFVRALGVGIVLPIVAMFLLLPYQGHGWGYRYLHGLLGNLALLGGYGWHYCAARGLRLRLPMAAATALSLLVLFPIHAWLAHRQTLPFATLDRAIAANGADIVIVDDRAAPFARDLVINRSDLSNRPLRMRASEIDPATVALLCTHGTIAFVDADRLEPLNRYLTLPPPRTAPPQQAVKSAAAAAGCRIRPF